MFMIDRAAIHLSYPWSKDTRMRKRKKIKCKKKWMVIHSTHHLSTIDRWVTDIIFGKILVLFNGVIGNCQRLKLFFTNPDHYRTYFYLPWIILNLTLNWVSQVFPLLMNALHDVLTCTNSPLLHAIFPTILFHLRLALPRNLLLGNLFCHTCFNFPKLERDQWHT